MQQQQLLPNLLPIGLRSIKGYGAGGAAAYAFIATHPN